MGAEAEMKMDGGNRFIPSSRSHVRKNINGILSYVSEHDADVLLLQEVSFGSVLNYWHNIEKKIRSNLTSFNSKFATNFKLPLILRWLRNEHGLSTYVSDKHTTNHLAVRKYQASEVYYRVIKRKDRFISTLLTPKTGDPVAIINTHLASFDDQGLIRKQQCAEVMAYAQDLYRTGVQVIIGADWNMQLAPQQLYNTSSRHFEFPKEMLPRNWLIQSCPNTPTARSTNQPYEKGVSDTAVIDGFVCSPGITVESVRTVDLHFEYSDHHPVEIVISY